MSAEQLKNFPILPQPSSPTFLWAMGIISVLVLIEVLAAGWKLFPELVDEWTSWRVGPRAAVVSPTGKTSHVSPSNEANLAFHHAVMMETAGQTAKALGLLKSLQAIPNLPPALQTEIQSHLRALSAISISKQTDLGANLGPRDEVGLPSGSTLGIIECKLMDGKPIGHTLRIAMKARPGSAIDVQNVKIHVYFYEKTNDGEVVLTDSPIRSEWLSPPVDWSNGTPQILDVLYSGPQASSSPNTFYGYVVGIYYNGELQDSRAIPVRLVRDFPPPLFLTTIPKF